jgi:hypothetical protein
MEHMRAPLEQSAGIGQLATGVGKALEALVIDAHDSR